MEHTIIEPLILLVKKTLPKVVEDQAAREALIVEFSLASAGFGDLGTNVALRLSSILKQRPLKIAQALVDALKAELVYSPLKGMIGDVKAEGAGFINFYLQDSYFLSELQKINEKKEDYAKIDLGLGRKVIIEFVSANPTGPLSVAHARQAAVGDALANIMQFLNFKVAREYYLNDEGNQINILGNSVNLRRKELAGESIEFPENHYQGDYIYDLAKEAEAQNIPADALSDFAAQQILGGIEKELKSFGVNFDSWFSQKESRKRGDIEKTLLYLKEKKHLYEEGGALWFKSTALGDDKDRVVIKSDKSYTYLAPDIAYHRNKYERGFQWVINLWGPDHHGYIARLKAAVAALGYDAASVSIVIVQLATISRNNKPIEMSTRKGQYITLKEVLDEVGADAGRFFFMMRRTSSHLNFDLETAKKHTPENPVYYVQYAFARIASIIRNSGLGEGANDIDYSRLKEKEELALIKKLWQMPYILSVCLISLDPYMLTVYLQEVAEAFHRFYDRHRVLTEDKQLTIARLALVKGAHSVLSCGLGLLGISKPEKM